MSTSPTLSIIIPTYHEWDAIEPLLVSLAQFMPDAQVIISDGSSDALTKKVAEKYGAQYLSHSASSRPASMNYGAWYATGEWLLFLHADACVMWDVIPVLNRCKSNVAWGCMRQKNSCSWRHDESEIATYMQRHVSFLPVMLYVFAKYFYILFTKVWDIWIHVRSRFLHRVYGDQGIFVRTDIFHALSGYNEDYPLFEDQDIYTRMCLMWTTHTLPVTLVSQPRKQLQVGLLRYIYICMRATKMFHVKKIHPKQIADWVYRRMSC